MANSTVPNPSQQVCWQSAGSRRQIPPGTIVLFPREDDGTGRDDRPHDYHGLLSLGPWDPPSDRPCVLQYRVLSCWILGWSQNIKLNGHIPPTRTRVVELLEFHYYRYLNYVIYEATRYSTENNSLIIFIFIKASYTFSFLSSLFLLWLS